MTRSAAADSAGAFGALLARLSADGGDAQAYEALRRRLIQFFKLHVPAEADDLADVVLDRLARRIHEGIDVASVPSYALGIARMVLHEARAKSARRHLAEVDPTLAPDEVPPTMRAISKACSPRSALASTWPARRRAD